jgi:hypothetical protein
MTQIYYFTGCCGNVTSFGISSGSSSNWVGFTATTGNVYGVVISPSFSGCVTYSGSSTEQLPLPILYNQTVQFTKFNDCKLCVNLYPCYTPPTPSPPQIITGYKNECGIITIIPMGVGCATSNPSSYEASDGEVSVIITGGTPPYTTTWTNGPIAPAFGGLGNGSYTATTVDYWGDFTATTVCEIFTEKDCELSASITEFFLPTPTPTQTPTQTKTPTQTQTQTQTPTPTMTNTQTPTRTPGASPNPTPTKTPTKTPTPTPTSSSPSFNETFTMIARDLDGISSAGAVNNQFTIISSAPFRVVWGDGDITNYPAGGGALSHIYDNPYTGNILIQSPNLSSITSLVPGLSAVSPQITTTSTRYLEIETSQLALLDGLITYGLSNGISYSYFTSGDINDLPLTLISFTAWYSNCSGDIVNLPPYLEDFTIDVGGSGANKSNTISGDIANLPTTLNTTLKKLDIGGNNAITGNISNLPTLSLITLLRVDGLNTISGNISLLSAKTPILITLYLGGLNTVSGDLGGIPNTVTSLQILGRNTVTGDISTLPPNINWLEVRGVPTPTYGNTLYGDIGTLPYSSLSVIIIEGKNTISGNISGINLKTSASLTLKGLNQVTGNISGLGNAYSYNSIIIDGNNTIFGNIQDLPSNGKRITIQGSNIISGDLYSVHGGINTLIIKGNNTISTFSTGSPINYTGLKDIEILSQVGSVGFNNTNLDNLLIKYASSTWNAGGSLRLRGISSPQFTPAAQSAFNTLVLVKNVTITIES